MKIGKTDFVSVFLFLNCIILQNTNIFVFSSYLSSYKYCLVFVFQIHLQKKIIMNLKKKFP